jgi:hypothetical protein
MLFFSLKIETHNAGDVRLFTSLPEYILDEKKNTGPNTGNEEEEIQSFHFTCDKQVFQ